MNQLSLFETPAAPVAPDDFIKAVVAFGDFGKPTQCETLEGIPYFVNEFWTAGQRQAHSIHEVSYRACFKAQLPAFFISRLSGVGEAVHDPFMGRGTTPVQAALMGRVASGNDINPLSVLLTRPRLRPINAAEVSRRLADIDLSCGEIRRDDLLAFYHPETLKGLEALRDWLAVAAPLEEKSPDPVADWIRMVSINRLSGHSPGFFSGRSMPPNQAVSVAAQVKINEKLGVSPPVRDIRAVIAKKTKTLLKDGPVPSAVGWSLHTGNAWETPNIESGSVSLVITSPPFLDIVQYAQDNWLRCWFAGIDSQAVKIAHHRTEEAWTAMVHDVLKEQARILRPGGHVAFEVGEVRNGKVLLERLVWAAADGLPFERLGVMINDQTFTKTANCWGVSNGSKGTNTNRIVLLRRN
ncbi:MAG: site-specific DNA-methyltransferase [Natronohydrobacter sp.]|nr:site-specific DNA-methyltransferase [Natronohydrobacter sp.]